jgi:hypothetical protein
LFFTSSRFDEAIIRANTNPIYPKFAVKVYCDRRGSSPTVREGAAPAGCRRTAGKMPALRPMKTALKYGIAVTLTIA